MKLLISIFLGTSMAFWIIAVVTLNLKLLICSGIFSLMCLGLIKFVDKGDWK